METKASRPKKYIIFRYLGLTSLCVVGIQLVACAARVCWHHQNRLTLLQQKVEHTASFLAVFNKHSPSLDDTTLENLLKKTIDDNELAYGLIIDDQGNILNSFLNRKMSAIASEMSRSHSLALDVRQMSDRLKQYPDIKEIKVPIFTAGQLSGEIRIAYSVASVRQATLKSTEIMLGTSALVGVLSILAMTVIFQREVRSPLRQLLQQADFNPTAKESEKNTDEFNSLQVAIQTMTEKLQKLEELQQHLACRQEIERQLEDISRAKSEFLAIVSHEIRTPLNAIAGMTELLADTKLDEEQKEFVDIVRISGERLLTMINNILDFSKIEAKKLELEEQPFHLAECIEESLRLFLSGAIEKNLELAYLLEPQTPTTILGDSVRLRQILSNLLSNAIKFTKTGEIVVYVSATPINEPACDAKRGDRTYEIRFAVKDTGIGIPAEHLDRLFKSFSQVDASTTRKYGGTGLGLSISKELCELMGGKMWVHSSENQGSTFYFTAIVKARASETPDAHQEIQRDLAGKRVLIVDDNATNQKILTLQAQSWGMYTCAVESGTKAIEWLKRGVTFDVALLDMQLPDLDGIALAKAIRQQPHCQKLPLVMLTSLTKLESHQQIQELDFAAIASKPIGQTQLHNIFRQIFSEKSLKVVAKSSCTFSQSNLAQEFPLEILVADDRSIDREVMRLLLEKLGYRPDVASNGIEVLKALQDKAYDVIFMDVQMPEMDGIKTTQKIALEHPEGSKPRIIAITAEVGSENRDKCLAAGMDDYLAKPTDLEQLRQVLSKCQPLSDRADENGNLWNSNSEDTGNELFRDREIMSVARSATAPTNDSAANNLQLTAYSKKIAKKPFSENLNGQIRYYLQNTPIKLHAIASAIECQNLKALQQAIQDLKTLGTKLEANRLICLCRELEVIAEAGDFSAVSAKIPLIEIEYKKVCQAWQQSFQQPNLESSKR
jgi:signal transduction histidine kinase/DNA-binding response OmpR family regulator